MIKIRQIYLIILSMGLLISCGDDVIKPMNEEGDLTHISYDPTYLETPRPEGFPVMAIPEDNPLTQEGVALGRFLFYDPILSEDSTIACASCHMQNGIFTDLMAVSTGIYDQHGDRSSMTILNAGYFNNGLFWDGRRPTLEEQAHDPVIDPREMGEEWLDVVEKLRKHDTYPKMMRQAFGIQNKSEISSDYATKAIAQFMRTVVSQGNSKYDKVFAEGSNEIFTDAELNGYDMFFDISPNLPDAECAHCHNAPLFTTNGYFNNGLQKPVDSLEFQDNGRGDVTGVKFDNGKFRAPSLRNIALTAPYMHDGRFETLMEVIDHYNSGGHFAQNVDPLIRPLHLSEEQKSDLLAFLHTLTDTTIRSVEAYSNPFE